MCLAVPMKLISRDGDWGIVQRGGLEMKVQLALVPDAQIGASLIIHVGMALSQVDDQEIDEVSAKESEVDCEKASAPAIKNAGLK